MSSIVSRHGGKRLRERAGLGKKSLERAVARAFEWGKTKDHYEGGMYRYLFKLESTHPSLDRRPVTAKVYGNNVYLFGGDIGDRLITSWPLPSRFFKKKPPKEHDFPTEELVVEDA